ALGHTWALSQADQALHRLGQLDRIKSHPVLEYPLHLLDVIDVLRRVTRDDHEIRRHARRNGADAVVFTQVDRAILGRDVDGLDGRETCLDQKLEPTLVAESRQDTAE